MLQRKFAKQDNNEFVKTLQSRVSAYFKDHDLNRKANIRMVFKTILFFGLYVSLYLFIIYGGISNLIILFVLWALLGLNHAIVGMTVMHDTVHRSYSQSKLINLLLEIPIMAIGVESNIWKIEHNRMHHNFTNIEGLDQDISPRYLFRFTEHQPRRWFHRFQHIYAPFFYGFLVPEWLTIKDFLKVGKYYKMGFLGSLSNVIFLALSILLKKSIFYLIFLVFPLLYLDLHPLAIVLMFLLMLVVSGITMTIIFQTAHVIPNVTVVPEEQVTIEENWLVHQMITTSNFANDNRFVTYILGGLNFQIEHHLFPDVCHVHYPKIAHIIKATALEYKIPYHYQTTAWDAISSHFKLLRDLGRMDNLNQALPSN